MSSTIFWALTAIVCLAPLPLASNRPLPWSLLSVAVAVLLVAWGGSRLRIAAMPGPTSDAHPPESGSVRPQTRLIDRHAVILVVGFGLLMTWYWVQGSPALSGGWAHPAWAEAAAALGESLPASASLDPAAGETLMMKILAYGGIFLLAFHLGRDRLRARMAFWLVAVSGLAYALYGLFVQFAGTHSVLWFAKEAYPDSVTATFVNRNAYATYAGMTILAALAMLLAELKRLKTDEPTPIGYLVSLSENGSLSIYLMIAAVLVGLVAVVLTGSRAGIACVVLSLFVFAIGMLAAREMRLRTFLVGCGVGAVALTAVLSLSGGFLAKRLTSESAPEARAVIFDVARSAAAERPLLGHGLGAFEPAFNRANDGRAVFQTYVDLAHNSYLELVVEGGIPALLLSLTLIGGGVGICIAGVFSHGRNSGTSIAAMAIATLVGAHAMVDFGIQIPAVAANFMLLIGVAAAQALSAEQTGRQPRFQTETEEEGWRSPRRRRFGMDRPHDADEPVTPPPVLEVSWPARAKPPDLTALSRRVDSPDEPLEEETPTTLVEPPAPSPARAPEKQGGDYEAALARWRALRQAEAAAKSDREPPTGHLVSTRPPAPSDAGSDAAARERATSGDPMPRRSPFGNARQRQPNVVPFTSPAGGADVIPPRQAASPESDTPDDSAQPPTPSEWPGAAGSSPAAAAGSEPARKDDDRRVSNIVELPRSPRS